MARKLEVQIVGDASGFSRAAKQATSSARGLGSSFGRVGKIAALTAGGAGIGALAVVLKQGIGEFSEAAKVGAQTEAVLKSTGGAAQVTAGQISQLATSLMLKSGVDDEAIQSGENMLLTFTRVRNEVGAGNDIFNQATRAALDMSVAMGKDMTSSAMLVGKALNDPIKGMAALSRAGVQLTEAQRESIKTFVEHGDVMSAQKVLLGELTTQFGGSAEALGKTLPGQVNILKQSFNNLAGEIVASLVPSFTKILDWTTAHWPEISRVIGQVFSTIRTVVGTAVGFLRDNWDTISRTATTAFNAVRTAAEVAWPRVQAAAQRVVAWYQGTLAPTITSVVNTLRSLWARFGDDITRIAQTAFTMASAVIKATLGVIKGVVEGFLAVLRGDWGKAWESLKLVVSSVMSGVVAIIRGTATMAYQAAVAIGSQIVEGVLAGISNLASRVGQKIAGEVRGAIDWAKSHVGSTAAEYISRVIATPMGEGVLEGWIFGTRDLPAKMKDTIRHAIEAARAQVESLRGKFADAWGTLANDALSAFDGIMGKLKTKSEKILDQEELKRQIRDLKDGVAAAKKELDDALREGVTLTQNEGETDSEFAARQAGAGEKIKEAQKALDDALWAQKKFALEQAAEQERVALDARIALMRRHLEQRLAELSASLQKEGATHAAAQAAIVKLLRSYGVDYKKSGQTLGEAFAEGMAEAQAAVAKAADKLAKVAESRLKLNSPAEKGPLSDLDTWWSKMGATLVGGMGGATVGASLDGALAGATGGAGRGGDTYHITLPNYLGSREEAAREIYSELQRYKGRNVSAELD